MTQYPEAVLARELELCYANISLITDYDVGVEGVPPVTHEEVVRVFTENNEKLRDLLFAVIPDLPAERDRAPCATALTGARFEVTGPPSARILHAWPATRLIRVELAFRSTEDQSPEELGDRIREVGRADRGPPGARGVPRAHPPARTQRRARVRSTDRRRGS